MKECKNCNLFLNPPKDAACNLNSSKVIYFKANEKNGLYCDRFERKINQKNKD